MGYSIDFKNRDRLIQLGIAISTLRHIRGMSQEELAEKAEISRAYISNIEAPNIPYNFNLNAFFNIADALDVPPEKLIVASVMPDDIIGSDKNAK